MVTAVCYSLALAAALAVYVFRLRRRLYDTQGNELRLERIAAERSRERIEAEAKAADLAEQLAAARKQIRHAAEAAGIRLLGVMLLALVLVALGCRPACCQESPRPEDGARYHLVVVTSEAIQPHERLLLDNLARDPSLAAIRKQCHFAHYTPANPLYAGRYAAAIPPDRLPAVMLARPDGGVVYFAAGDTVPASAGELFDQLEFFAKLDPALDPDAPVRIRDIARPDCPDGRCPPASPSRPAVTPEPPAGPGPLAPYVRPLRDSSELLRTVQPVKNSVAAVVWIVGGVLFVFVGSTLAVLFVGVLWIVAKVLR
jgi:hypothetical protein